MNKLSFGEFEYKVMAKVTIIMPTLNVEKYIDETINSVLRQTLRDIELIIIDAGSSDKTVDIISRVEHWT